MYAEDDHLSLSGLQHFAFCRRQWALIHIETQWAENLRTVEGDLFHRRAHDEQQRELRGNVLILRGLPVFSPTLGLSGKCDVVEFHADPTGVPPSGGARLVASLSGGIQKRIPKGRRGGYPPALRPGHVPGGNALLLCFGGRPLLRGDPAAGPGGVRCGDPAKGPGTF